MSTFLSKIHYLLYNKIQLNEKLLEDTLKLAGERNIPFQEIKLGTYEKYGYPETRPLEDVINHENIHGWLQLKIQSVENRTAVMVTELINNYNVKIDDIAEIYYNNGKSVMENNIETISINNFSPKDLYSLMFEYLLEGMPCDRVSEIVSNSENEFTWQTTGCIHKEYWDKALGDISNFYVLRDSWIKGFLKASGTKYSYTRTVDGYNIIKKG